MKSLDYINKYRALMVANQADALTNLICDLTEEIRELIRSRKASKPKAMLAVFREINQKFKKIVGGLGHPEFEGLFKDGLSHLVPTWGKMFDLLRDTSEAERKRMGV